LKLFKGEGGYYFINEILKSISIMVFIYAKLEDKVGRKRIFTPLPFIPVKKIWRWYNEEEIRVMDLDNKTGYALHGPGARIWELISEQKDANEITSIISREYTIGIEDARNDISDFISEFREKSLIPV
jgi:hypothetical protein